MLGGAMISMGRTLEKLGPALYSPGCVEGKFSDVGLPVVSRSSVGSWKWQYAEQLFDVPDVLR